MAAKDVKFTIKIGVDGSDKVAALSPTIKKVADNVDNATDKAKSLTDRFMKLASVGSVVDGLCGKVKELSAAIHEAQQSKMTAAQMTGLDGKDLDRVRAKAKAVADTFGTEYNEVMLAANNLSKAFGTSAQEALKLVQDGFVTGANANGEYLDTLREYPRYFQEAGISAQEFIAITANAAQQGIYSDKGVDTIKEGNLRIREMTTATADALNAIGISATDVQQKLQDGTITTFQVMQQVAAKLAELPASSAKVGTAIADIFGGPGEDAGLEYIKSLATINTSLEDLTAQADETSKALGEQADKQTGINTLLVQCSDILTTLAPLQPFLNFAAQAGLAANAVSTLIQTLASLNLVQRLAAASTFLLTAAKRAAVAVYNSVRTAIVSYTFVTQTMSTAEAAATIATNILKVAIRGLMIATGVGAIIAGLSYAIDALTSASGGASDSVDELTASSESARQAEAQMSATLQQQQAQLQATIVQLKNFKGTKEEEKAKVQELNNTYGQTLGYYNSVAQWYAALVNNSRAYCEQMIYEAKVRKYASQIAELEGKKNAIKYNEDGTAKTYSKKERDVYTSLTSPTTGVSTSVKVGTTSDWKRANEDIAALNQKINGVKKLMDDAAKNLNGITFKKFEGYTASAPTAATTTKTTKAAKSTAAKAATAEKDTRTELQKAEDARPAKLLTDTDYQAEIKYWQELQKTLAITSEEYRNAASQITNLQQRQALLQKAAARPEALYTTADYQAELEYQNALLDTLNVKSDEYAQVSEQIERLNAEMEQLRHTGGIREIDISTIDTYAKLNAALSYYNTQLEHGGEETRIFAQKQINALNDIKDAWDKNLAALSESPVTIKAEEDPTTWAKGSKTDKRKSYTNAQARAQQIQTDISIGLIGADEAKAELEEINGKLREMGLKPIEIELDIKGEKRWQKFFKTARTGWNSIKGIGDGIEGITNAVESDGNAWKKTTAVIDGALQIYDGITAVMEVVHTFSTLIAGAKTAEAAATTAAAAASATEEATESAALPTKATEAAANKTLTSSVMELAAAQYMLAHASIPFAGFGIGAGFASAAAAFVEGIGVMPFANGGLVYGPTLALMGEYSGASTNPEVIAPLDKLKSIIGTGSAAAPATIRGKVRGRDLVLTLANETRISRRKTNIKL